MRPPQRSALPVGPIAQDPTAKNLVAGTNRPIYTAMKSWNQESITLGFSNAAPVDLNIREGFPEEDLVEFIRQYAVGDVGSNLPGEALSHGRWGRSAVGLPPSVAERAEVANGL